MNGLKLFIKISITILLCVAKYSALAQRDPYAQIERVHLIESLNDSINLAIIFRDPVDDDDDTIDFFAKYASFDKYTTHYPTTDFSNKQGVTIIPLIWGDQRYVHPCDCPPGQGSGSRFGLRTPFRFHFGIDTRLRTGDPVYSVFDGVVRIARRSTTYGFFVVVRHLNGLETYYAHLSRLLVEPGQEVKAGELIGLGGNTGRSRGAHLHFEIRYLGAPLNPEDIICFDRRQLKSPVLELSAHHFRYLEDVRRIQQAQFHTVRRGDTLGAIARRYGTTVGAIARMNGIRTNAVIRPGQRLRVR